eukprot:XP_017945637.1 PREDICTED: B-cell receptor CD22-like [Xenopus tropicalis]
MMERYRHLHRIILMVVLQGGFPGSYSQDWAITLPESIRALRGSCVEIPCTFTRPRGNKDFRLVWYKGIDFRPDKIIFSQQNPSDVSEGNRGRTSLVGNEPNSCSLRINDVRESDSYYPYIHGNCDVTSVCQTVRVTVSDVPNEPAIQIPTDLTEGKRTNISCSVEHTCPPRPPTLQWNRAGYKLTDRQQSLKDGVWKAETVMEYLPSYRDHKAKLECEATYPNGLKSKSRSAALNIRYKAQNVTIKGKDEVKEGAALELECHFSDYNPPTTQYSYSWYLNGNPVNGETGRILQINNITESHSGNYSCNVQNGAGPSYSPGFAVTVMSAQTGEGLPMRIILGGGAVAVLVILLVLALYLFLRTSRKKQKLEASGGRGMETNNQGHGPNEEPENYYCNVSAIAGSSRNGTAGTQMGEIELEDIYTEPKEPIDVEYTLVDHVPGKEAPQTQNPTDETEYSLVTF